LPFVVFELKHNWSQVRSMAASTKKDIGAPTGKMKLIKVIEASGREMQQRIVFDFKYNNNFWYWVGFGVALIVVLRMGKLTWQQGLIMVSWIFLIMLAQFVSKRVVSEYYFTNIVPVYLVVVAIFMANILDVKRVVLIMGIYLIMNCIWLVTKTDEDQSYLYRRQVVEYVKKDAVAHNYPCIAVNFIADPGVGVGFRYLFWYYGLKTIKPGTEGVPVYNIPIPWQLSRNEKVTSFGRFGVILPVSNNYSIDKVACDKMENQLDPLLGYTE
jgi:hypothetical protein